MGQIDAEHLLQLCQVLIEVRKQGVTISIG